jgi:uncharacterized Zn finger protein (UPF0148 family)
MLYKACPKCGGDLMVERGFAGESPDIICLQCGRRLNAEERAAALQRSGIRAHGRHARTTEHRPTAA